MLEASKKEGREIGKEVEDEQGVKVRTSWFKVPLPLSLKTCIRTSATSDESSTFETATDAWIRCSLPKFPEFASEKVSIALEISSTLLSILLNAM